MEARADNWQNESQVIPWRRCRGKSRFWKNAPARKFINIPKIGGNCKTWKTISTSSVCLWRYLPSKAKANVWGQNLNCCDLLVSANFPWLGIVRHAKKKKVLFCHTTGRFSHIFLIARCLMMLVFFVLQAKADFVHTTILSYSSQQADIYSFAQRQSDQWLIRIPRCT